MFILMKRYSVWNHVQQIRLSEGQIRGDISDRLQAQHPQYRYLYFSTYDVHG